MGCSNSTPEWDRPPPYTPYPTAPAVASVRQSSVNISRKPQKMEVSEFGFGIEIEAVVQPWKRRSDWSKEQYYEQLAQALRNRDLPAKADPCTEPYRKHPEHYTKWFITRDGSIATRSGCIALEAVSPKMKTDENWEDHIGLFWEAMTKVFQVQKDISCGSHIHVAPIKRRYTLAELKKIAFAICLYESYVYAVLPAERKNNPHCELNSKVGTKMGNTLRQRTYAAMLTIANEIRSKTSPNELCAYMQGSTQNRKVLWNFQNTITLSGHETSGTLEFRGGRHLRGKVRTLRWITFAVAFIAMALDENLLNQFVTYPAPSALARDSEVTAFWAKIRRYAYKLRMDQNIPIEYKMMNETKREP